VAIAAGDLRKAIDHLLVAAQRDPLAPEHLVEAGRYAFEAGQIEEAEMHLRNALAIDPGESDALRILGDHYLVTGRRPEAEKLYRDWADYDPDSAAARVALGKVRLASRDYQGALAYYDEAVALGDMSRETGLARIEALRALGRPDEADAAFAALPPE
jgi:tetratricopeptide (TPR) repeat protein